jgi:hypothetical protein
MFSLLFFFMSEMSIAAENLPQPCRHRHGGRDATAAAPPWTSLLHVLFFSPMAFFCFIVVIRRTV